MSTQATNSQTELVEVKIDGVTVSVPKGTLIIRAAEEAGIRIPRFCDHPLLKPVGACRQCLVQVAMPGRDGVVRPMPKPQPSCAMTVSPGMEIETQHVNEMAAKAQKGVMEFLLINHPLDCPICDKGGECPLQNQAMSDGCGTSRFTDKKRTFPKPVHLTSQIILDRDRCILCQRCTRFADQIPGDRFIALQGRGGGHSGYEVGEINGSQIGTFDANILNFETDNPLVEDNLSSDPFGCPSLDAGYATGELSPADEDVSGRPFSSYFGGNIIQICPVGALTSEAYRFRSRPFDLMSTPSITEHDSSGSAIRVDVRRGVVLRRQAGEDSAVNEEWITDKDRFAFTWQSAETRLTTPLVREGDNLEATSWSEALALASQKIAGKRLGFLPGGRLTLEDNYGWAKFARVVAGTNDIDARVRDTNAEELSLIANLAGTGLGVTYEKLEKAGQVLLVGFEPEDEVGSVFLRLRKGVSAKTVQVATVTAWATRASEKINARVLLAAPNAEATVLEAITENGEYADLAQALQGGVILIGERAACSPGIISAAIALAQRTGATWQWIPRRAGERAAAEVGALPNLLPYGRAVDIPDARVDVQTVWGIDNIPAETGRNVEQILQAVVDGELDGIVVGGVDLEDFTDPQLAKLALSKAEVVVQLEVLRSEITDYADVVFPVAPPAEKAGTFVNWEGRLRPFGQVLVSHAITDHEVLDMLAQEMGKPINTPKIVDIHNELRELGGWDGARSPLPTTADKVDLHNQGTGEVQVASWRLLLDEGTCQQGDVGLAGSARKAVARMSENTAKSYGISKDGAVTISGKAGAVTLPVAITKMPDQVVWVPQNSVGCHLHGDLGVVAGQTVTITAASMEVTE